MYPMTPTDPYVRRESEEELEREIHRLGPKAMGGVMEFDNWLCFATPDRLGGITPGNAIEAGHGMLVLELIHEMMSEQMRRGARSRRSEGPAEIFVGGERWATGDDAPGDDLPF